jgi:peptide/nickel transport system permease protein
MSMTPGSEAELLDEFGNGHTPEPEAPDKDDSGKQKSLAGRSPTQIALDRLRKDRVAVTCAIVLVLLVLLAIFAGVITRAMGIYWNVSDPNAPSSLDLLYFGGPRNGYPSVGPPFNGFSPDHPLGVAPRVAYDNLAYLLYGLRTSLIVATVATVAAAIIGLVVGLVAGYAGGRTDSVISFITDLFLSLPYLLMMLALAAIITQRFKDNLDQLSTAQFLGLIGVLVFFGWMGLARLIRGQVFSLREREFVQAARVIGVPTRRILFKELLPNLVAPIVVWVSLSMPAFVAAEVGLSFLGLGLTGRPSLGKMVSDATKYWDTYPLYLWLPVAVITILTLSLNLLGDSIRDAFDPKTRR